MATLDDVRAIALGFPGAVERVDGHRGGASWRTTGGPFAWQRGPSGRDLEQLAALGRDWPPGDVIGVRTDGRQVKEALLESFPDAFFTIPHFDGYPAVLVRLDVIDLEQALGHATRDAAASVGDGTWRGRLEAGLAADFAIVDVDPFAAGPESLLTARVVRTVVAGATVYDTRVL